MSVVEDPVCGMEFTEEEAETLGAETHEHEGETYYLCSPTCLETFQEEPDVYL
jgi:Cu+-exporting ATPase